MDQHAFERDRDRDKDRKKKRGTRARRLVALPDREPVKTNRSRISGGMDEAGVPIVLSVIPKLSLPAKTTPSRAKTAPRRAAAIAAKASITTMTSELQQEDHSAAPSPEQNIIHAVRASRRNRINSASPEPAKPVALQPVKEETSTLGQPGHSGLALTTGSADRTRERPTSAWTCSNCHRPETVLDDKRRFDGPVGRPNLCSDCGEPNKSSISTKNSPDHPSRTRAHLTAPLFPNEPIKSKEATPPPFQDVASPDSTMSEDGPAPASTSLAAPTPSPVVPKPSEVQSPRVPMTPSRPGMALQRVTSGSVSTVGCRSCLSTWLTRGFRWSRTSDATTARVGQRGLDAFQADEAA